MLIFSIKIIFPTDRPQEFPIKSQETIFLVGLSSIGVMKLRHAFSGFSRKITFLYPNNMQSTLNAARLARLMEWGLMLSLTAYDYLGFDLCSYFVAE